ncbi:inlI [Symbiodinium natans]|uniref:InlI protein n=1 Tax=Symbiodinium natans TaxID=878477 RepID=A0A812I0T3_9DINO|nr:inlI [Symbiodinium natans]
MDAGIELQHRPTGALSSRPSWFSFPAGREPESFAQQTRVKFATGVFAGIALIGSLALAALNLLAQQDARLALIFEPCFPVLTPLLFFLLAGGTACGLWITTCGRARARDREDKHSWIQAFKASGKYFHAKVALLEVLQLFNQGRTLRRLLFVGQGAFWVRAYSALICANAVVTPLLHFSPRVQHNTFFLTIFDAFVDTTFGAVLPACMVAEAAVDFWVDVDIVYIGEKKLVQAFLIGQGLVPTTGTQLLSLAWPYLSLWVKLLDLRDARELWGHGSIMDQRRRVCGPWLFGCSYLLLGLSFGLLGVTARQRSPCYSKPWREGCEVFRFDFFGRSCECAYYARELQCGSVQQLEAMLRESKWLQVLHLENCGETLRTLPPFTNNARLRFLLLNRNSLRELPPLGALWDLRELHVSGNLLRELPDLSSNGALQFISAEHNQLTELPSLAGNRELRYLMADSNNISVPPDLRKNSELLALGLNHNDLVEAPSLVGNLKLEQLYLEGNSLTELPSLNLPRLEILNAEANLLKFLPSLHAAPALSQLWLMANELEELPSMDANTKLEFLDVTQNRLRVLPSLEKVRALACLRASSNALQAIPAISPRARLAELSVAYNQLRQLDLSGMEFQSLRILNVQGNLLESIPGLGGLASLTHLGLRGNRLKQLPALVARKLHALDVSSNRLQELSLPHYLPLQHLSADHNQLTSIRGLDKMTDLIFLHLRNNSLTELPDLEMCTQLKRLSVNDNLLSSIGPLPRLLLELNASTNRLRQMPPFPDGSYLHILNVEDNLFEELSFLTFSHLIYLNARDNKLKQLPTLQHVTELRYLDVSGNQLTSLPPLQDLSYIMGLCVSNNSLRALPNLSGLHFLHSVGCAGNPLKQTPHLEVTCDCCAEAVVHEGRLAWCNRHKEEEPWDDPELEQLPPAYGVRLPVERSSCRRGASARRGEPGLLEVALKVVRLAGRLARNLLWWRQDDCRSEAERIILHKHVCLQLNVDACVVALGNMFQDFAMLYVNRWLGDLLGTRMQQGQAVFDVALAGLLRDKLCAELPHAIHSPEDLPRLLRCMEVMQIKRAHRPTLWHAFLAAVSRSVAPEAKPLSPQLWLPHLLELLRRSPFSKNNTALLETAASMAGPIIKEAPGPALARMLQAFVALRQEVFTQAVVERHGELLEDRLREPETLGSARVAVLGALANGGGTGVQASWWRDGILRPWAGELRRLVATLRRGPSRLGRGMYESELIQLQLSDVGARWQPGVLEALGIAAPPRDFILRAARAVLRQRRKTDASSPWALRALGFLSFRLSSTTAAATEDGTLIFTAAREMQADGDVELLSVDVGFLDRRYRRHGDVERVALLRTLAALPDRGRQVTGVVDLYVDRAVCLSCLGKQTAKWLGAFFASFVSFCRKHRPSGVKNRYAMEASDADFAQALSSEFGPNAQQGMSPNTASAREEPRLGEVGSHELPGPGETSLAMRAMMVSSPASQTGWSMDGQRGELVGMATAAPSGRQVEHDARTLVMGGVTTTDANMSEAAAWSLEAFGSRRPSVGPFSVSFADAIEDKAEGSGKADSGSPQSGDGSSGDSTKEAVEMEVKRQMQGILGQLGDIGCCTYFTTYVAGVGRCTYFTAYVAGVGRCTYFTASATGVGRCTYVTAYVTGVGRCTYLSAYDAGVGRCTYVIAYVTGIGRRTYVMAYVTGVGHCIYIAEYVGGRAKSPFAPDVRPPPLPAALKRVEFEGVPSSPMGEPDGGRGGTMAAGKGVTLQGSIGAHGGPVAEGGEGPGGEASRASSAGVGPHPRSEATTDTVTKLLEGLEKVISGKTAKNQEEVGRVSVEMPKLPEMSDAASVDFGDWLHCLENVMGDISAGSAEWWGLVREAAQAYYDQYQAADQFVRISLKPTAPKELSDNRWVRVDRRGVSMILGAVPEEIRRELVATRARSTLEVLCRLMVLYRPGSATEKSQLLKRLEEPGGATSPQEAVEMLRLWHRVYQRAKDLALITPDPSILLKALDGLVRKPLQENAEVTFRMQLLRYHLKVDITPSVDGVLAIHRAYLAEFEQLAMRKGPRKGGGAGGDAGSNGPATPKMRAIGGKNDQPGAQRDGSQGGGQLKPCRFFLTDEGCRRGKACKFEHAMDKDKRERCWTCGSKQHTSKTCPTKVKNEQQGPSPSTPKSGSGSPKKPEGPPETPSIQKVVEAEVSSSASTSVPASSSGSTTMEDPVQGVPVEQLLESAHRMMKAFIEGQQKAPTLKVLRCPERDLDDLPPLKKSVDWEAAMKNVGLKKTFNEEERMGLLDSGATHALRPATSRSELDSCFNAEVTLAGDQKVSLPQTQSGVILAEEAQPIVPLGSLVKSLGYEFVWNSRGCRLRHDSRPEIQVFTRSSCPEVRECDALRLIAELESQKVEASMQSIAELRTAIVAAKQKHPGGWKGYLQEYVRSGDMADGLRAVFEAPFMQHVPVENKTDVLEYIPKTPEEAWKLLKRMPLNRSRRRQLWRAKGWVVHLFAGRGVKGDPIRHVAGEILEVDIATGWDLLNKEVYALLLWAAMQRKIKAVIGGPPCRTFSLLRYRDTGAESTRMPKPVRSAEHLWGLPNLGPDDREMVKADNRLILRMVWLWLVAEASLEEDEVDQWTFDKVGFGFEHPDDPREFLDERNELWSLCPSVWRTHLMEELEEVLGLVKYQFDQGAYGHEQRKPTAFLANMQMNLRARDTRRETPRPTSSASMAVWAPGFRKEIARALLQRHLWEGTAQLRAMTAKEAAGWKDHLDAGHWPYRRDCAVCLAASGSGRPARKVLHRDAYVLSLDVAGAFRDLGIDEKTGRKYRFVLAGTYIYPKGYSVPKDQDIPLGEVPQAVASDSPGVPQAVDPDSPGVPQAVDPDSPGVPQAVAPDSPGVPQAVDPDSPGVPQAVAPDSPGVPQGVGPQGDQEEDWFEMEDEEEGDEANDLVEGEEASEKEWKKLVGDLKKPHEFQILRFAIPLEKHRGKEVLEAVQDIYVTLKSWGMPLARIHSDRAKEFRTQPLRRWCRARDIFQTFTEGCAPSQNSVVEGGVKWLKSKARLLLGAAGIEKKFWPCAMKEACDAHNRRMLARPMRKIRFGSVVWIKSKKTHGPFDPRWEKGTYLGPTEDVREGHVVLLENGTWLRTLHVRLVRDDEYEEVAPEYAVDWVEPSRRVRGKMPLSDPEVRKLKGYQDMSREQLVKRLLGSDIWTSKEAVAKRPQLRETSEADEDVAYVTLGAYQHGGIVNVTNATMKYEEDVRTAAALLRHDFPGETFTSMALVKNAVMPIHRDSYNMKGTSNLVSPLNVTKGSGVWQEMKVGDEFKGKYEARRFNGKEVPGQIFEMKGPMEVNPSRLHEPVLGEKGPRILVVGFTIAAACKLEPEKVDYLRRLGCWPLEQLAKDETIDCRPHAMGDQELGGTREDELVIPGGRVSLRTNWSLRYQPEEDKGKEKVEEPVPTLPLGKEERLWLEERAMALRALIVEEAKCADQREDEGEEVDEMMNEKVMDAEEELDFVQEILTEDAGEKDERSVKAINDVKVRLAKMATDVTTENVEGILKELKEPLTVTHTVALPEVKANLPKWVPSIMKEVTHLEGNGTLVPIPLPEAKRMQDRGEITLVPAKTVHTVKPPDVAAIADQAEQEREHVTQKKGEEVLEGNGDAGLFKRKSRLVICGNYIKGETEVFTTAASAESLRCGLAFAAQRNWGAAITDIASAFTLTPMSESSVRYAITIPKVIVDAGCAPPDTAYLVERLLYGLKEAPRLWGNFRDRRIRRARIHVGQRECRFVQMETDPAVWRLVPMDDETETIAMMIVYVDDVMFLGGNEEIMKMYSWLTKGDDGEEGWKCSDLEWVGQRPVRYLGMEVQGRVRDGRIQYHISQGGYIADLIREYGMETEKPAQVPATKDLILHEEEGDQEEGEADEEQIRAAQTAAGELLWLATRTQTGHKLCHELCLCNGDAEPDGCSSFGSPRAQALITLSTAEAELYELIAAHQLGLGIQAWATEVQSDVCQAIKVDNTAALGLASTAPGTWKTRHLRVRARFLRQEVLAQRVSLHHEPGEGQPADLGTKPVPAPRLVVLRDLWGMVPAEAFLQEGGNEGARVQTISSRQEVVKIMALMIAMMSVQGARAEEVLKRPVEVDGSVEFYVCVVIGGVALLGVWEFVKVLVAWVWRDREEMAMRRTRRLMKIRDQAARALHRELAELEDEGEQRDPPGVRAQDPTAEVHPASSSSTTPMPQQPDGEEGVTVARAARERMDFRCLQTPFVMSEHGDRIHVREECHGLRHANKAKLRKIKYCSCCAESYPLYYRPSGVKNRYAMEASDADFAQALSSEFGPNAQH